WVSEPTTRGTYGILSLCLSTMLISVWSALHLDVPTKRPSLWQKAGRNSCWILMGLLCPEVILYHAICQLWLARRLVRLMSTTMDPKRQISSHTYTRFYAAMGGFAFSIPDTRRDTSSKDVHRFLPADQTRMAITPAGVEFLIKHDPELIPFLLKTSITDRSRSNGLSKALLFIQVAWFCLPVSCLSRWMDGLSLSLLEITTIAHAMCTMLSYTIWWNKPRNIEEPTLI
ncbi:hypothetical protein SCHPADRAFT_814071, partial [Schizopora paradoxa]